MVICLDLHVGADLHMAQLMPLPLTVSCFSKIQTDFTFLVLAHPGSLGKRAVKCVCVCVCACVRVCVFKHEPVTSELRFYFGTVVLRVSKQHHVLRGSASM